MDAYVFQFCFFFDSTYEDINSFYEKRNEKLRFILLIFLLLLFGILTYFKKVYRAFTIKTYSPMTRALAESIIDPFVCIYKLIVYNRINKNGLLYYILILISLFIISFLSLVYNDFIVLYCCGLEYNTHFEIDKRSISYDNLNSGLMDDESKINEEENNYEKTELSLK